MNKFSDNKKSEKYPFLKNQIIDQKNQLLNIARASGFYFAKIDTGVIDNKDNSVTIVHNIELGSRAIIKK